MWELNYTESLALKNWCFWSVVLEKTLESPLDCKEIQPAHPRGDQSWVFTGRTDVEAETPILWPPDVKSWLIGKDPDGGKDWEREEKGTAEDEMVGWHHWLNGHGYGWTPGVGDRQGCVLRFMVSQRVGHNWATELNRTEWTSGFFYLNCAVKCSWSEPQDSSQSSFHFLYRDSPSLSAKDIMNLISVLTIWWCLSAESSLVLLEEYVPYNQWVLLAKLC